MTSHRQFTEKASAAALNDFQIMFGNLIELYILIKKEHDHTGFEIQVNSINFDSKEKLAQHVGYTDKTFSVSVNIQNSST